MGRILRCASTRCPSTWIPWRLSCSPSRDPASIKLVIYVCTQLSARHLTIVVRRSWPSLTVTLVWIRWKVYSRHSCVSRSAVILDLRSPRVIACGTRIRLNLHASSVASQLSVISTWIISKKKLHRKKLIPEILYLEILNLVNAAHENEYDQILNDQKKSHKSGGVANRSLQQRLGVHAEICASDTIFNVLSAASESKCAKKLSAEQLMIWNRTYSKFNTQGGSESHGDMMREDEDYFDCAWEIQAQRELMGNKKFTASVINSVARKCFFFRTPGDKFGAANGSYCGKAVAAAGAFMATA